MPDVPRRTPAQQKRRRLLADASIGEGPEDRDPAVDPPISDNKPDPEAAEIVPAFVGRREVWPW